jgi:hypothetical protein
LPLILLILRDRRRGTREHGDEQSHRDDGRDRIRVKQVTVGQDFGTKSEILGGLDPTDRVVQNPTEALQEGMIVSVERPIQGPKGEKES